MTNGLEYIPDEPPEEVEQVTNFNDGEREKLGELAVMLKAEQLFANSCPKGDPYRTPDDVTKYELLTETFSFLRDREGPDSRDRRTLVYRRLHNDRGELIHDSQVIEYRESDNTVEALITCNRYPDEEVPLDILQRVEDFLDYHLAKARIIEQ